MYTQCKVSTRVYRSQCKVQHVYVTV